MLASAWRDRASHTDASRRVTSDHAKTLGLEAEDIERIYRRIPEGMGELSDLLGGA